MCGIVGYIGKQKAIPILMDGLKRLEYRGYDSAGLATLDGQLEPYILRRVGRVANLEAALSEVSSDGKIGIAHTRWATHGKPTEENAHPHADCTNSFWVVHNGIVENYRELKTKLQEVGHKFASETDTEILVHLIEAEYQKKNGNGPVRRAQGEHKLLNAVRKALAKVRGTYGIAVMSKYEPDKIIAARNSSPLLLGIGESENVIASDASAVLGLTRNVVYLNDGEIAEVTANGFHIETLGEDVIKRKPEALEWDVATIEKNGHDHFMHKEIFECPETVVNASRGRLIIKEGKAKLGGIESIKEKLRDIEKIVIVACGTASYAGRIGEYMLEEYAGIPVEVDIGSEFRYRKPVLDKKTTALIAISQSGETADTLAAVREAKEKGVLTMGIVNVVGSTIARETGMGVYSHAGPEIGVASTKAFISQLTILTLLTLFLGRQRELSLTMGKRIGEELLKLPELMKKVLTQEQKIKEIARHYQNAEHLMFLGRKYNYPIAVEAALKIKETSYIHAEGYAAGEFKHGPIAMIDKNFPTFFIAPQDSVYEKTKSNLEEVRARNAPVIALTTEGNKELERFTDDIIYIPKTLEMLTPMLAAIPLYLFAYHLAVARGNDVDKPRNLAKSVTVE